MIRDGWGHADKAYHDTMGLPGLCNTLQYFVEKGFASDEILEMHINNLIEEAKKVYVTIYIPRKTQHS